MGIWNYLGAQELTTYFSSSKVDWKLLLSQKGSLDGDHWRSDKRSWWRIYIYIYIIAHLQTCFFWHEKTHFGKLTPNNTSKNPKPSNIAPISTHLHQSPWPCRIDGCQLPGWESSGPKKFFDNLFTWEVEISPHLLEPWVMVGLKLKPPKNLWDVFSIHLSNYSDLIRPKTPNGGLVREIPLFQGNPGWWNIIIWSDTCVFWGVTVFSLFLVVDFVLATGDQGRWI